MRLDLDKVESMLVALARDKQAVLKHEANQLVAQANQRIEDGNRILRGAIEQVLSVRDVTAATPGHDVMIQVKNADDGSPVALEWDDAPKPAQAAAPVAPVQAADGQAGQQAPATSPAPVVPVAQTSGGRPPRLAAK